MILPKVVVMVALMVSTTVYGAGNFKDEFEPTFGGDRMKVYGKSGQLMSLALDKYSGSGFRSKKEYLHGRFDLQMKLIDGDSAGTVTTFYLSSDQSTGKHDEFDFEFLGNTSGQPYTLHTNVFSQGKGGREEQFHLWFDPRKNFHTYTILWNAEHIMFMVDEVPIREFKKNEDIGVPFPKNQPMRIYSSLWNADDWATQGGRVKTDWSKAPFRAYFRNVHIDACHGTADSYECTRTPTTGFTDAKSRHGSWRTHALDGNGRKRLRWARKYFMVYDYCKDVKRFKTEGYPAECRRSKV